MTLKSISLNIDGNSVVPFEQFVLVIKQFSWFGEIRFIGTFLFSAEGSTIEEGHIFIIIPTPNVPLE